ncbi:MAG TPA: hypothetical protein VFH91_07770 [Pyrinomonadaceae bacterium]|nr:hypothetical protein [Pyrinomonadaceae bacterium]
MIGELKLRLARKQLDFEHERYRNRIIGLDKQVRLAAGTGGYTSLPKHARIMGYPNNQKAGTNPAACLICDIFYALAASVSISVWVLVVPVLSPIRF